MKKVIFIVFLCFILICAVVLGRKETAGIDEAANLKAMETVPVYWEETLLNSVAYAFQADVYINGREVFENAGYTVSETERRLVCAKGSETIELDAGKQYALKNALRIESRKDVLVESEQIYITGGLLEQLLAVDVRLEAGLIKITDIMNDPYGWKKHPMVAHALGAINGKPETCTLEAFQRGYQDGFRLFECDFILTSDGGLIARHDWSSELYVKFLQAEPEGNGGKPLTTAEIKAIPVFKDYTALSFEDVAYLMSQFKDIYLITDTKETEEALVRQQFASIVETAQAIDPEILDRIIPQFYLEDMLGVIQSVYAFPSYIYTLYMTDSTPDEVLAFSLENQLQVITMHYDRANADYMSLLSENGIRTYVHTLNSVSRMREYLAMGVHGFYSDYVTPRYFQLETESSS